MEYVRNITEAVRMQDEVLKAQLVVAEDAILKASTEEAKVQLIAEAHAIYAKIVANRPDVKRRQGYNPSIRAQNRIDDAQFN